MLIADNAVHLFANSPPTELNQMMMSSSHTPKGKLRTKIVERLAGPDCSGLTCTGGSIALIRSSADSPLDCAAIRRSTYWHRSIGTADPDREEDLADCPIVVTVIGPVGDGVLGSLFEADVQVIVGVVGEVEIGGEFPVVAAAGIGSEIVIGAPVEED